MVGSNDLMGLLVPAGIARICRAAKFWLVLILSGDEAINFGSGNFRRDGNFGEGRNRRRQI
jgi:hypothetical protein